MRKMPVEVVASRTAAMLSSIPSSESTRQTITSKKWTTNMSRRMYCVLLCEMIILHLCHNVYIV